VPGRFKNKVNTSKLEKKDTQKVFFDKGRVSTTHSVADPAIIRNSLLYYCFRSLNFQILIAAFKLFRYNIITCSPYQL